MDNGNFFPASSLDPYTRLLVCFCDGVRRRIPGARHQPAPRWAALACRRARACRELRRAELFEPQASVADIVTKARQSLHQSLLGCLAVALALGTLLAGLLLLLVLTSLLWVPLVSGLVCSQLLSAISRNLITMGGISVRRVRDKTLGLLGILVHKIEQWVTGKTAAGVADELRRRRGHEAAIKDRSFMRNLFEALPGVDTERALQRIDHLQQWALAAGDLSRAALHGIVSFL
jgi:hypothetical protein